MIKKIITEKYLNEDEKPTLKNELIELINNDLSVSIQPDTFSEDKEGKSLDFYFYIPLESNNLYFQIEYSDNSLDIFMIPDPKTKSQQNDMQSQANAVYNRPIPILGDKSVPDMLMKLKRSGETSIENKIREYLS